MPSAPGVGENWIIEGEGARTPHGYQVEVRQARRLLSDGAMIRTFLANHVPGVGYERASRLWDAFGSDLSVALGEGADLAALATIMAPDKPSLGLRLAAAVTRAWQDAEGEARLMGWFDAVGYRDYRLARRLYRIAGDRAQSLLIANPYVLVPLLNWRDVEALAKAVGTDRVSSDVVDRRRLVGAVDEVVKRLLATGATAISEIDLETDLGRLLETASPVVIGDAISYGEQAGAIIRSDSMLRAPGAAVMEQALTAQLIRLRSSIARHDAAMVAGALDRYEDHGITPHLQQIDAAHRVILSPLACLIGGAGTGKTFTCRMIVETWEALGGNVLLCALAGKAALRLSRSTGRLAKTLARTLAELAERERLLEEGSTPKALEKLASLARMDERTLVVVDEASMVDLPTMHALVRRLPEGAQLLLVGDDAQLPPVGFGIVFHKLVKDATITVELSHVHRQAASTGIPQVAAEIRTRRLPTLQAYAGPGNGVVHHSCSPETLQDAVCTIARELGDDSGDALIVTATNGGKAGVDELNRVMQRRRIDRERAPTMRGHLGRVFAIGDPVIYGRNDYGSGLVNGMMGRVTEVFADAMAVEVEFEGEERRKLIESEQLLDLDLAYAVTCHKCQGSSAPRIVVPMYRTQVLDPSWIYTAITRAEQQVVLVGDLKWARGALSRLPAAEERLVGLSWPGGGQ